MSRPRVLGMDFGEKRVGLALSDSLGLTSQPLGLIERRSDRQLLEEVRGVVEEHDVRLVVVGHPVGLSNRDTARARRARSVMRLLRSGLEVSVRKWDERLSTAQAERVLRETGTKPARKREKRDVIAAQLILQTYLDRQRARRPVSP